MRGPRGTIKASTRSLFDAPILGEIVMCTDPAEDSMIFLAEVTEIRDGGVVLLEADWSSALACAADKARPRRR